MIEFSNSNQMFNKNKTWLKYIKKYISFKKSTFFFLFEAKIQVSLEFFGLLMNSF